MGGKSSSLTWCEYSRSSAAAQTQPSSYIYSYKVPPPSYNHQWTDLHYAASHGNIRRIHEIIHKSGTIYLDKKDYYGKTPLYWAAYKGHITCIEVLLKFGSKVNTQCRHGGTPLHAVVSLYPESALLLIKHGADVNLADNWGVTPMYLAASSGQVEVIEYLLSAGARLTFRNKKTGDIPKQLLQHKDYCEHLLSLSTKVAPLKQLCRITIRNSIGEHPISKICELELPKQMKDYLTLDEFG